MDTATCFALERATEVPIQRQGRVTAICSMRSYWTSDCEILSTGHSLCALITRTCDPSDRLMRACEHVLSSIFLTSISVVGSHCKVSPKSAGHMRHAEQSLNSTIKHSSCFVIRITNLPHVLTSCVCSSLTFR